MGKKQRFSGLFLQNQIGSIWLTTYTKVKSCYWAAYLTSKQHTTYLYKD